ncbi:DUF3626 domain-containing protein [Actinoplanes sp. NBC_00393]|uniref:DUF3626 domain-containing protein n=1 Tax=Actinoplanes sp. NBC_00393 TaxID=2975953 RepID=UPI002E20C8A1
MTVNFHPDRLVADGRTVAQCLADDGVYRSQFETRISNGGLTAYPVGDRDRWEHRMFGGAYTGTAATFGALWQALSEQVARTGTALGVSAASPQAWIEALATRRAAGRIGRALDDYVEAQIHGGLTVSRHVAAVVADRYRTPILDAAVIGRAARDVVRAPHEWSRFDDPLQLIKYLWHILVLRGEPREPAHDH